MNRFLARTSKLNRQATAAFIAAGMACAPLSSFAQERAPSLWFMGSRVIFSESRAMQGDMAVSINDPGLQRFLSKLGARVSFQSGQDYVVVTAADRKSIAFSVGSTRYTVDGSPQDAPFAVSEENGDAFLPFYTLARALDVMPVRVGDDTVMQPQIADIETQVDHGRTVVIFHGAAVLHPQILSGTATRSIVRFPGTSSTLQPERDMAGPGISHLSIAVTGSPRNPTTTITFLSPSGAHLAFLPTPDETSAVVALSPLGVPLQPSVSPFAENPPSSAPSSVTSSSAVALQSASNTSMSMSSVSSGVNGVPTQSGPIAVTGLSESATPDHFMVKLAVTGTPNYHWRMLGDGRFYIDVNNAALTTPMRDEALSDPRVSALRLRSNGTPDQPNVRLALSLTGTQAVAVTADEKSITLFVGGGRVGDAGREGAGRVGQSASVAALPIAPPGASNLSPLPAPPNTPWKFTPSPGRNNRLIVIDPGHGGSDSGAEHNGLTEKVLTLDIARRLRTLLIARGWDVKMTRDSDVDVYAPNDSAHDELQARCDIANAAGARLFVSIHINSFTSSDLQGTTTYYYHPQDQAFAQAVENRLISNLGTQNDGAQHANFYVIHHTTMPAILVETAFLSNPDDAARLRSESFRQTVASSISDGITSYVGGNQVAPRASSNDTDAESSYAPPHHQAQSRSTNIVRSASSMDDDLSQ